MSKLRVGCSPTSAALLMIIAGACARAYHFMPTPSASPTTVIARPGSARL
jgi:hypothetical protein